MTSYGYIGLGQMGLSMTECLLSHDKQVTVFDLSQDQMDKAIALGANPASSPAEVASKSDIVSICVPAAKHIRSVLSGNDGIGSAAVASQTILIHSTVSPSEVTSFAEEAAAWGAQLVEACIAGGGDAAKTGDAVLLVGGIDALNSDAVELLSIYGSKVIDGGAIGAGASLKLGINIMSYAQFAAASCAFDLVESAGGSTESLTEAWRHIGQLGKLTESFLFVAGLSPAEITGEFKESLLRNVDIAEKDLMLAASLCAEGSAGRDNLDALGNAMAETFRVAD